MSEWDFLWGLSGQALEDAMSSGATYEEWSAIEKELDREFIGKHGRNVFVFVDGENIPSMYYEDIRHEIEWLADERQARVYARQLDQGTKGWHKVAMKDPCRVKEIRLCGGPAKNKVDKKIIKDMQHVVRDCEPSETLVFLVTSDSDYAPTVRTMRSAGVRVVGIGEEKTPERLRKSYDRFVELIPHYDDEEGDDDLWRA